MQKTAQLELHTYLDHTLTRYYIYIGLIHSLVVLIDSGEALFTGTQDRPLFMTMTTYISMTALFFFYRETLKQKRSLIISHN